MSTNEPAAPAVSPAAGRRPPERRRRDIPVALDRRTDGPPPERGRKPLPGERRRLVDPTTCERDYVEDEIEFMKAMDQYKRDNRRPFPTWSEVLEVLMSLGYRKTAEASSLPGNSAPVDVPPKG